jgi:hypothetical protein
MPHIDSCPLQEAQSDPKGANRSLDSMQDDIGPYALRPTWLG